MQQEQAMVNEPVLPMDDIQGIAVPGFFKPHQTLMAVVCGDQPQAVETFKALLKDIAGEIATAQQTLKDRRRHRQKKSKSSRDASVPLIAVDRGLPAHTRSRAFDAHATPCSDYRGVQLQLATPRLVCLALASRCRRRAYSESCRQRLAGEMIESATIGRSAD